MWDKLHAVVLGVIKYSDKNSIAHVYTRERGRMSFLVPQGSTRGARMRNAAFLPLSIIEFEAKIVPGKELHSFRDLQRSFPLANLYADPMKSSIALFVSELLSHVIIESESNPALFEYLQTTIRILDSMTTGIANFHICFMYNLSAFLGIQPDASEYQPGDWFDLENGTFSRTIPMGQHKLRPEEAATLALLDRMTFSNLHLFRFNREQRNQILDTILLFFAVHNNTVGTLKSPEILKQLFV